MCGTFLLCFLCFQLFIWSCQSQCDAPLGITHARYPSCQGGATVEEGGTCVAQCGDGFEPTAELLTCSAGNLFPEDFTCEESACAALTVTNAETVSCFEGASINHRGICTTHCSVGFKASTKELACSLGEFFPPSFTCDPIVKAATPVIDLIDDAQPSTLNVEWTSGDLNDCMFSRYLVQWQEPGAPWTTDSECSMIKFSATPSCIVRGLPPSTEISLAITTECVNELANSDQSALPAPVSTTGVGIQFRPARKETVHNKPDMIMLMFSHGVQLKAGGPFTAKMCNVGTEFHCDSDCETFSTNSPGFSLLPPDASQFAFWEIDPAFAWKQRCSYRISFASVPFETSAAPLTDVAIEAWEFDYQAEPPKFAQPAEVGEITESTIELSVVWDKPCRYSCRAEGEAPTYPALAAPGVSSNVVVGGGGGEEEGGDGGGMTLKPLTSYIIQCQAWLIEDENARSGWVFVGNITTEPERNAYLEYLKVYAVPQCQGDANPCADSENCVLPFNERWDRTNERYTSALTTVDYDEACGAGGTEARWNVIVEWMPQGDYSTTSTPDCNVWERENAKLVQCFLPDLVVTETKIVDEANMSIYVQAMDLAMPPKVYTFAALALAIRLKIEDVKIFDGLDRNYGSFTDMKEFDQQGELQLPWKIQVQLSSNDDERMSLIWDKVGLNLGPFKQRKDVSKSTVGTLHAEVFGIGRGLPLWVTVLGSPVVAAEEEMAFVDPEVHCISLEDCADCPDDGTKQLALSLRPDGNATVCLKGTNFGSEAITSGGYITMKIMSNDTTIEMCKASTWVGTQDGESQFQCIFSPTTDTIQLEVHGPTGCCDDGRLGATHKLTYVEPKWKTAIPSVLHLHSLSSITEPFELELEAEGLPIFYDILPKLTLGTAELCDQVLQNTTHVICQVVPKLDIGKVCDKPSLKGTWGYVGSDDLSGEDLLSIRTPVVQKVTGAKMLVGTNLKFAIYGKYFGEEFNGPISIYVGDRLCNVEKRNETTVVCKVEEGPMRDDLISSFPKFEYEGNNASISSLSAECFQPLETDPPTWNMTYSNMSCNVQATVMLGGFECSQPVSSEPLPYNMGFHDCQTGRYISNVTRDDFCVPCAPGTFQPHIGPLQNCRHCGYGEYQELEGQEGCVRCPGNTGTERNGSDSSLSCLCDRGFYVLKKFKTTWSESSFDGDVECTPCMRGGDCLGGMIPPWSREGYHMISDPEYQAVECPFRKGCLYNNTCQDGYIGTKCENCDDGYYTNIGWDETTCEICSEWIMFIGTAMPIAAGGLFLTVIAPIFLWRLQAEWASPDDKSVPVVCFGLFIPCLKRLLHPKPTRELPTGVPCWRRLVRKLLELIDYWLVSRVNMKGAEFQRVVSILTNTIQILLLTGGINVEYWPSTAKIVMASFRPLVGMIDAIHPECFVPLPMFWRWFGLWALPYGGIIFLEAFVWIQLRCSRTDRKHAKHVQAIVAGGFLHILLVSHIREDLKVYDCREGRLELEPKVACNLGDATWVVMFSLATGDLCFVVFLMYVLWTSLTKTLLYYKTKPKGTDPPLWVSFTKWWCIGFRPQSTKHDQALREVQHLKQEAKEGGGQVNVQAAVNAHNEKIFQKNAQSTGMELRRLVNPLLGEGQWPLDANITQEANFNQWSRTVSMYVHKMLQELDQTWCMTNTYMLTSQDVYIAFKWEWYNVFHKLCVVCIELLMTKYQWWGSRSILLGQSIYIALFIWVRPYKNAALNNIDAILGIMLCVIIYCVILEEGKDDDLHVEHLGPGMLLNIVETIHVIAVIGVITGSFLTGTVWLVSWLQDNFLQETFYVFQAQRSEDSGQSAGYSPVSTVVARKIEDLQSTESIMMKAGLREAKRMKMRCAGETFQEMWKIIGEPGNDDSKLDVKQSIMMPCRAKLLMEVLDTHEGDMVAGIISGLPKGSGMRLARGGDLQGRIVVPLTGEFSLGKQWVEYTVSKLETVRNVKNFEQKSRLKEFIRIADKTTVPRLAMLKAVGFAPDVDGEQLPIWVSFESKDIFLEKYNREFRRVPDGTPGTTYLSFSRHGKADLYLELCEEILNKTRELRLDKGYAEPGMDKDTVREQSLKKGAENILQLAKKSVKDMEDVIKVDLRFKLSGRNAKQKIPAHVQNQDGKEDSDIFVLERHRQEWICRGDEIRFRLGIHSAIRSKVSTSDMERLFKRSVWQSGEKGLIVIDSARCCKGSIGLTTSAKPDEDNPENADNAPSVDVTWQSTEGAQVIGSLVEGKKIYWQGENPDLPQGPWSRVLSAFDGIPGPDSGLWRAKHCRHVKLDKNDAYNFAKAVDEEAFFQATEGADELHERSRKDFTTSQTMASFTQMNQMAEIAAVAAIPVTEAKESNAKDGLETNEVNPEMEDAGEQPMLRPAISSLSSGSIGGQPKISRRNTPGGQPTITRKSSSGQLVDRTSYWGGIVWFSVDPRSGSLAFYPRDVAEKLESAWQLAEPRSITITSPVIATLHLENQPFQVTGGGGVRSVRRCKLDDGSNRAVTGVMVRPGSNSYWAKDVEGTQPAWRREAVAPEDRVLRNFVADPNKVVLDQTAV